MNIHIGIPLHDKKIQSETAEDIFQLLLIARDKNDQVSVQMPCSPFISLNRNLIMQKGLDADWILMIDSDISVLKTDFVYDMIETAYKQDAVVVGLLCRLKLDEKEYACGMKAKDGSGYIRLTKAPTKPQQVDVMGAGVTLIKTDWIKDNLVQPYFEFIDGKNEVDGSPTIIPEDWRFCEKIKEKGGKIIVEPRIGNIHWGIKSYVHEHGE